MNVISAHSPRHTTSGGIELFVRFDKFPDEDIPFHAHPNDSEIHGRALYTRAYSGEFGEVAPAPVTPAPSLSEVKAAKQAEVKNAADRFLQSLAVEYGAMEKLTWDQQAAEADSLLADAEAPAPLVRSIAAARNIDVFVLAGRIRDNRTQWLQLSGHVVGKRLAYQDALDAATTVEGVAAITPVFS